MQDDLTVSYKSGMGGVLERHHVMNGPLRDKAEKYGLWVKLTPAEHRWLHDTSDGQAYARMLKAEAQKVFEEQYGRIRWMHEFHRNYRED